MSEKLVKHYQGQLANRDTQAKIFKDQLRDLIDDHKELIAQINKFKTMSLQEFESWQRNPTF